MDDTNAIRNLDIKRPWNYIGKVAFNCDICGNEFYRLASKTGEKKFCTRECYLVSKRMQKGELHPLYQRTEVSCLTCGNSTNKSTYKLNRSNKHFCSIECKRNWNEKIDFACTWCGENIVMAKSISERYKTHFCSKKCMIAASRARTLKLLSNYPKETLPEKLVKEYLSKNGIDFIQYAVLYNKFNVDFLIPIDGLFKGVIVEVLGDFFHCNPIKYPNPIYHIQKKSISNDKRRVKYLSDSGYLVLGIWECDIKNDIESALEPVIGYLKNGIVPTTSRFEHLKEVISNE